MSPKAKSKIKKVKVVEPFFKALVDFYFSWYRFRHDNAEAPFLGSAPRDLKNIIIVLREKVEGNGLEWNKEIAKRMLLTFLDFSLRNENVHRCNKMMFLASVNRNKQIILDDIKKAKLNHNRG